MDNINLDIKTEFVNSTDGTVISYKVLGRGPGLVIVHGGFRASQHYIRLAEGLADTFTVYIIDRRGRNQSGEKGSNYCFHKECEDAIAVLKKHGATYMFGHSFGGLVSLNVALEYPIEKLALYEPAISINGSIPTEWVPRFEKELKKEDYVSASVTFLKGMQMGGMMGKMPRFILKRLFGMMAKGPEWEENCKLLYTLVEEIPAVTSYDNEIEKYKEISALTLMMSGTKSPSYLTSAIHEVSELLPNKQSIVFEGFEHNAPDEREPEKIAKTLKEFFV